MARMPGAVWQGEHGSALMSRYDIVCVHTIVGYAPAHAAHFSTKADGTIYQSRDTRYKSAANLDGNHRVIAIENEDHGSAFGSWNTSDGHAVPALTPAQVEANARILRWAHDTHGVPLQLCPDSRPTSRGLAYHRQGIDGNFASYAYPGRVSGGEVWTKSYGKVCPGDRKIAQLPEILRRASGGSLPTQLPTEEQEMPYPVVRCDPNDAQYAGRENWYALTPNGPLHVPNQEYQNVGQAVGVLKAPQIVNARVYDVAVDLSRRLDLEGNEVEATISWYSAVGDGPLHNVIRQATTPEPE